MTSREVTSGEPAAGRAVERARQVVGGLVRRVGPVVGVGWRALQRDPVWTTGAVDGSGIGAVVVPGFCGTDASMALLRRWLTEHGFATVGAGLSLNLGCTADMVTRLERRVAEHAEATGGPVVLVGHSRGGWVGRLVAVRRPDLVRGLAMLGSPVLDPLDARGPSAFVWPWLVRLSGLGVPGLLNRECVAGVCRDVAAAGLAAPLEMPAVAIYSRSDGVVGWRSCQDPAAVWVEVTCTHNGMGIDPDVYRVLASHLAAWTAPAGQGPSASTRPASAGS